MSLNRDRYEDLVDELIVSQSNFTFFEGPLVARPKLQTPAVDRFVGNDNTAFSEQVFDIAETQAEAMVKPNGATDDFGRKNDDDDISFFLYSWR